MKFSASQIAALLNGTIEGNADVAVSNLSKIEDGKPETLSFLANPQYTPYIYTTDASIVIVNNSLVLEKPVKSTCTLIRVEDAYGSFAQLLEMYNQVKNDKKGIEQPSYIAQTAKLGKDCYVAAFAYIGENVTLGNNVKIYPHAFVGDNTKIADNTTIYAGAKIYSDCVIGADCTIHAGVVIGADGFGFAPNSENNYKKIPQIGNVIIEDHVEVGSNTTIDRATLGSTIIRKGAKLDNLIQIGHNVEIGENTVIAASASIAGSTKVGKNCMIGGQAGLIGHLKIADGVKIAGQTGVGHNVKNEGEILQGSPAMALGDFQRCYVIFRKLPKLSQKISELEKQLSVSK
ncbi:MAG TPA: UDP-3-O-(3-hydroxymyristoyl)glucosamine N-acyltransferase [Bacteroidia bacterium]|jgi:UDP-3-O-[3-hydroxymyristoyl] glucosamine N-acyltransferase|nr:UDP-3-O-(3-hydroxymyristoyl)glucosamine N-acyltransferase [Bacteroidia bacterium]